MAFSNVSPSALASISTTELFSDPVTFLEKDFSTVTVKASSNTEAMTVTLYISADATDPPDAASWAVYDTRKIPASDTDEHTLGSVPNLGIRHMRIGAAADSAMTAGLDIRVLKGSFA